MKKQLCDELMSWRHQNKCTQLQMAEDLGVSQSTYHKWESCKCEIPTKYYLKISKVLGLDLQEFIPDDLQVFVPDNVPGSNETIQFSAMEMLRVIEQNNQLLQEKVRNLESKIAVLQKDREMMASFDRARPL